MGNRVPFTPDTSIEIIITEYRKRFKHALLAFGSAWVIGIIIMGLTFTGVIH